MQTKPSGKYPNEKQPVKPAAKITIAGLVLLTLGLGIVSLRAAKPSTYLAKSPKTSVAADTSNPQAESNAALEQAAPVPPSPALYTVARDIDGDTIDVKTSTGAIQRVRLIGVDTPETHDPRKTVQCFGQVAAAYTKTQLEGKLVRLVADPEDSDKDKYGRLLRYVYLGDALFNQQLIAQGYGFAYVVFPYQKIDDFRKSEREARVANRGLWNGCNIDESKAIKQTTSTK